MLYQYGSLSRAPVGHYSGLSPWSHQRPILAVVPPSDVEDLSCNEISGVGDEEGYCGGDVFGVSDAAPGDEGIANSVV